MDRGPDAIKASERKKEVLAVATVQYVECDYISEVHYHLKCIFGEKQCMPI